jgi:hypothetical protein
VGHFSVDNHNRPHIGYSCFPNESYYPGDLRYAYFDGTAWLTETVDSGGVGPTAVYSWPATGTNVCGGEVVDRLPVRVLAEWPYYLYLPLVQRP